MRLENGEETKWLAEQVASGEASDLDPSHIGHEDDIS